MIFDFLLIEIPFWFDRRDENCYKWKIDWFNTYNTALDQIGLFYFIISLSCASSTHNVMWYLKKAIIYLDESVSDLMDVFGVEFVSYISNYGYDRVLRILYVMFLFWFYK
jgi:hypothetical protein